MRHCGLAMIRILECSHQFSEEGALEQEIVVESWVMYDILIGL